ncbi:uncharacterized protein tp53i13 [Pholidichthys leucotaenia]
MGTHRTSPWPLTVTLLAAVWVSADRCDSSQAPVRGCDNGKVSLHRDLPVDMVYWDCATSPLPESTQRLPSIYTVNDPEPARQICMDKHIFYNHTIPNSGAHRPIGAESGEYLYCPPQRWLNNIWHGATVLLHHPCAPPHERLLLSHLARSCLTDYIITPHPLLKNHLPVALVSWGRTLELSTVASSDICVWLDHTQTARRKPDGVGQMRRYNLLLVWSAEQHRHERPTTMKESLRSCCKRTLFSLLDGGPEAELISRMKKEGLKRTRVGSKSRQIRAAIGGKQEKVGNNRESPSTLTNITSILVKQPNTTALQRTEDRASVAVKRTHSNFSSSSKASKLKNQTHSLKPSVTTPLRPNMSETDPKNVLLRFRTSQSDTPADNLSIKQSSAARPEALAVSSKDEGTDSIKQKENDPKTHTIKVNDSGEKNTADGSRRDNEVIEVEERAVEHKHMHGTMHSLHKNESNPVSKTKSGSQPRQNPEPAGESRHVSHECDGCTAGDEHCDCAKASGTDTQSAAAAADKGLPRMPRTDEAVWAAAALGFLLVLLTLSVLHTRLYRQWRTMPSLYWHDPRQDYDSVADVIRRRLRIAQRRRKRSRRQECVLLPSSSSSDEH